MQKGRPSLTARCGRLFLELLVAVCLALLIWLYARTRDQDTIDHVPIPVEVTLAPGSASDYDLEVSGSGRVSVAFNGPLSRLREVRTLLQRDALRVAIQLSAPQDHTNESTYRETVRVQPADVPVPPGVSAVVVEGQNRVPVVLRRLVERRLPVRLDYFGEEPAGQVKIEPDTVLVRGPQDILERARVVPTQPVSPLAANGLDFLSGRVDLVAELEGRPIRVSPPSVSYRVRLQPQLKVFELTDVPVQFLCPPDFRWAPRFAIPDAGKLRLRVRGPTGGDLPAVHAFIDLSRVRQGGRKVEPVQLQLPQGVRLAQEAPPEVEFFLEPVAPLANVRNDEPTPP
jgi:hypothetical protein